MHTQSIVAVALVAAASVAAAETENRPRIYFPRQVKRVFTNTTIPVTSPASPSSSSTNLDTSSTKRDAISDLLNSLGLGKDTSSKDEDSTTTVVVPTTVYVSPSSTGTGSKTGTDKASDHSSTVKAEATTTKDPPLLSLPTLGISLPLGDPEPSTSSVHNATSSAVHSSTTSKSKSSTKTHKPTTTKAAETSSSSGILLFPTGAVTTTSILTTSSSGGGLLDGITSIIGTLLPGTTANESSPTAVETSKHTSKHTSKGTKPTSTIVSAHTTPTPTTSSGGGLLDGITSIIGTILPGSTANETSPTSAVETKPGASATGSAHTTAKPSTSSDGGLLGGITSLLPLPTVNSTESPITSAPSTTDGGLLPTSISIPLFPPPANTTESETGPTSTFVPSSTPSPTVGQNTTDILPTPTESASVPITLPPSSTPIANGTSSLPPTVSSTFIPSNSTTEIPIPTSTPPPVTSPTSVPFNSTVPPSSFPTPSTSLSSLTPTTTSEVTSTPIITPTSTSTSSKALVTSIIATATITDSQSWLPTSLIIQDPTGTVTTGSLASSATGIPTTLPMAISPGSTSVPQPPDSMMIQISFLYGEHYMHLVEQPKAAAQLFQLLPGALAYGAGIDESDIVMDSIRPYDTLATLGYITSQARLWYPNSKVNQLADDIKTPNAALYNQANPLAGNLTSQINPAIPIWLGSGLDGTTGPDAGGNSDSDGGSGGQDAFGGSGGQESTAAQRGTTAGIAIGALSVAGAYGAAMFVIARRYKRKKQRHQRSSSISAADEMRQAGSPALMGGALLSRDFSSSPGGYSPGYGAMSGGNMRDSQGSGRSGTNQSARTANISAPVAAENSLGWN